MTGFEIVKANRQKYSEVEAEITTMRDGIEKAVKQEMILKWIKGNKWMGGLSDSAAQKSIDKLASLGYDPMEVLDEFDRQIMAYNR